MSAGVNFVVTVAVIVLSMLAGYVARRRKILGDRAAEGMMAFAAVFGYSAVGFLTIWQLTPRVEDFWLPLLAAVHVGIMCVLGMAVGGSRRGNAQSLNMVSQQRADHATHADSLDRLGAGHATQLRGLMSIACGAGNNGLTMGGFILYMLYGENGLGMVTIYSLAWMPMTVLVFYPIARHFAGHEAPRGLAHLMFRSVFDWRSIGLPITLVGLLLAIMRVPRPAAIAESHIVDILMFAVNATAYMAIGLRLHATDILSLKLALAKLAAMRFVGGLAVGAGLVALTTLTPWPLTGLARNVFLVEAFVPTAVTMVAVANMFSLLPRQASVLFIVNTLMYLAMVLPLVMWFFGR